MEIDKTETLEKSLKKYGVDKIVLICMEELSELVQAISKIERYPDEEIRKYNLVEEIADVNIIIEYLKIIYDIDVADVNGWIDKKINRLYKKLEE